MPENRRLDEFAASAPEADAGDEASEAGRVAHATEPGDAVDAAEPADAEDVPEPGDAVDAAGPTDADDARDAAVGADDVVAPASVSPAASTSRFAPNGEACASCGDLVERTWLQDDDLVCDSCKSW